MFVVLFSDRCWNWWS